MDSACQAPLSMEFSRQECWSELPFPSPEDLQDPEIEPGPPTLQADSLPFEPSGKPIYIFFILIGGAFKTTQKKRPGTVRSWIRFPCILPPCHAVYVFLLLFSVIHKDPPPSHFSTLSALAVILWLWMSKNC